MGNVRLLFGLAILGLAHSLPAQQASPWLLPNFSDRLEIQVSNPTDEPVDSVAVIPVALARKTALRFPGSMAIAVIPGPAVALIATQADDLDGDGVPDELVVPLKMQAHERLTVQVYYSTTLHEILPWTKRAGASHSFGYNRATVALESEAIGYRTYGGFFLDVQARAKGKPGLNNSLVGFLSSSAGDRSSVGRDILHIGDTLGLGGLFLRSGQDVFRPPLNTPDYVSQPQPAEAPTYRVISDGPIRAVVEADMDRWTIGKDVVSIHATYSIEAGSEYVECHFTILPLSLSRTYEVGTGIRHLPQMKMDPGLGRLAVEGAQSPKIGPLGLALYFDPTTTAGTETLQTKNDANEAVIFSERLEPGKAVTGHYWVAASWSGSGIEDLLHHLKEIQGKTRSSLVVDGLKHERTPAPERLEGEAN
ncbi:MAG TPA: DUF4861 family protein [Acidobacteriaceae bacterium]